MMSRKNIVVAFFVSVVLAAFFTSCKPDSPTQPLEPISLVAPDSAIIYRFAGDSVPLTIKLTTDRPINWILGKSDVDTFINSSTYTPSYADTLFFKDLTTLNPRQNLYTYTGAYYIPDTLKPFSTVRLRVSFNAGSTTFTTGQNYPAGIVSDTKDITINIR